MTALPGWPRAMALAMAASYVGLAASTLKAKARAGEAPAPIAITPGRRVWLREDLDRWLDTLAGHAPSSAEINPWH